MQTSTNYSSLKTGVSEALKTLVLVQQGLIRNQSPRCTGMQGTYKLLDEGLEAAAEAFELPPKMCSW